MATATAPADTELQEYVSSRGATLVIDRAKGLIRGVKILGLESKNGRTYSREAIKQAVDLYEGKRVNVDHTKSGDSRSYRDRIGKLVNVATRPDGLYGDLHVNPQHMLAEQLFWDAENSPESVGLSHDVSGRVVRRDGKPVVEAINVVRSVDLVADPATTAGLFEDINQPTEEPDTMATDLKEMTLDQIQKERPELLEQYKATLTESEESKAKDAQLKSLTEELATIKATAAKATQEAVVAKELHEAKLDPKNAKQVPEFLLEQLHAEPDAAKRKLVIDDRTSLVEQIGERGKPRSEVGGDGGGLSKMTATERGKGWS